MILYVCWPTRARAMATVFSFWGGLMSIPLERAQHYRYLANEFRRLAANDRSFDSGNYYLLMAKHYGTLAEAAVLKTLEASEPRPQQFRPGGRRLANTACR